MNSQFKKLVDDLTVAESHLKTLENSLNRLRRQCVHDWTPVKYDPIVQEGYHYEGDPVGTMGVDWRPGGYVPRQETARWSRTCNTCGIVEYNTSVKEQTQKVPVFNEKSNW